MQLVLVAEDLCFDKDLTQQIEAFWFRYAMISNAINPEIRYAMIKFQLLAVLWATSKYDVFKQMSVAY